MAYIVLSCAFQFSLAFSKIRGFKSCFQIDFHELAADNKADFERLFLAVPWGCLRFVIVVFPDHTHLLFLVANDSG